MPEDSGDKTLRQRMMALLEALEGKRGMPRHKPPYPSQVGLFGRPTLVHNVETLYWVRDILEKGPAWFSGEGRNGRQGRRSFSVSGRVKQPGVKFAPAGMARSRSCAQQAMTVLRTALPKSS